MLAIGIIGALNARFRPQGMARAMFAGSAVPFLEATRGESRGAEG